jgi:glutathione S-transferase
MKLYMHPVSMTSRPVRLFIADNKIDCEEEVVDLMTGAEFYGLREAIKGQNFVRV